MKFIISLPDNKYYLWQMLVQMNNFKNLGYDQDTIYVIGLLNNQKSEILKNITLNSKTKCTFYTYRDERENMRYSSTLRPHIMKKFFKDNPEFEKEAIFYLDPDVIFTKKMKFSDIEDNNIWYLSDTKSYIGSRYIKSKGDGLLEEMCSVIGIDPKIVENNDNSAGGAQYFMKNVNWKFWEDVEIGSEELYNLMIKTSQKYSPNNPIQAWTADMWTVLWLAWKYEHPTKIIKRFDFTWATDNIKRWDNTYIFHNAGAINNGKTKIFSKIEHQISPFNKNFEYDKGYCSAKYVDEIKETEKNFKNLIW